jgi:hypothetical protein
MNTYEYVPVSEEQKAQLTILNCKFIELDAHITACVPEGRNRSIALTHLKTASMFANEAVSKDLSLSVPEILSAITGGVFDKRVESHE